MNDTSSMRWTILILAALLGVEIAMVSNIKADVAVDERAGESVDDWGDESRDKYDGAARGGASRVRGQ